MVSLNMVLYGAFFVLVGRCAENVSKGQLPAIQIFLTIITVIKIIF